MPTDDIFNTIYPNLSLKMSPCQELIGEIKLAEPNTVLCLGLNFFSQPSPPTTKSRKWPLTSTMAAQ